MSRRAVASQTTNDIVELEKLNCNGDETRNTVSVGSGDELDCTDEGAHVQVSIPVGSEEHPVGGYGVNERPPFILTFTVALQVSHIIY
jgi:hypothetical protein